MELPIKLKNLIESGIWPNKKNVNEQHIKPLVKLNLLNKLIPDESQIFFYNPPFTTVKQNIELGDDYWDWPEVVPSLSQIDTSKTLIIGDFGIGSETVLALDYSRNVTSPAVIRFMWFEKNPIENNKWIVVSESFDEFASKLELN